MARTSTGSRFTLRDFGTCINSTGGNVALATTTNLPIYNNTAFSIAFWVKINSLTTGVTFYGEANSAGGSQSLRLRTDGTTAGKLSMFGRDDSNNIFVGITSNIPVLVQGKWLHIAYTDNNGTVSMYVNGVAISLSANSYTRGTCTFDTSTIGAYKNTTFNSGISAKFDNYRLYKKALSVSEVQQIYYQGSEPDSSNLIGYYKFDEGSGTTATDSSGKGNTGTISGATYSTDVFMVPRTTSGTRLSVRDFGKSLNFYGSSSYVSKASASVYGTTGYSVEFWVKGYGQNNDFIYVEGSSGSNNQLLGIGTDSGAPFQKIKILIRNDANTTLVNKGGNLSGYFDGKWHHVVWTDNNGTCGLYIDGVKDSADFNYTPSGVFTLNQTSVGCSLRTSAGSFFRGLIDQVRTWNIALTQDQVTALYYQNTKPTTPYFEWLFDEGTGNTIGDNSGNGRTGDMTGHTASWSTDVFMIPRSAVT